MSGEPLNPKDESSSNYEEVVVDDEDENYDGTIEEVVDETLGEDDNMEEDVTEVEVDESEAFSDEGTTRADDAIAAAASPDQDPSSRAHAQVQEFEDWLWDSRRASSTTMAVGRGGTDLASLTSADVYTAADDGKERPSVFHDSEYTEGTPSYNEPSHLRISEYTDVTASVQEPFAQVGDDWDGMRTSLDSATPTIGADSQGAVVGASRDDADDEPDEDETDTSTLLAVAHPPSDAFDDDPVATAPGGARQRNIRQGRAPAFGVAAATSEGDGSADDDSNRDSKLRPMALPLVDKILIVLIGIVILILITALPIALTKSNDQDRNVILVPTRAPTRSPTAVSYVPSATSSPTSSNLRRYTAVGGPFMDAEGSGFGAAVALANQVALAGAPGANSGRGTVTTLVSTSRPSTPSGIPARRRVRRLQPSTIGQQGKWLEESSLQIQRNDTEEFGAAVSFSGTYLVAGAPGAKRDAPNGTLTGAAFVYQYTRVHGNGTNVSSAQFTWVPVGSALTGSVISSSSSMTSNSSLDSGSERFGAAVALSDTGIVAIGAPDFQQGGGGVYTFAYQASTNSWERLTSDARPLTAFNSGELFGSSVALSLDGEHLLVGAPRASNGNGRFVAYQWNVGGSEWLQVFDQVGTASGGLLGSSVAYLSGVREFLVVGAPGALAGNGLVQIYRKSKESLGYEQLGSDVLGEPGEQLGAKGTVSGGISVNQTAIVLLLGTYTGLVRRIDFDVAQSSWMTSFAAIDTETTKAVTGVSSDDGGNTVVVGISAVNSVTVYSASSASATRPPTAAPLVAPTTRPSGSFPSAITPSSKMPVSSAPATALPSSANPSSELNPTQPSQRQWIQSAGPFTGTTSSFGTDVAVMQSYVAAGDPGGSGSVYTYSRLNQQWIELAEITGTDQFGSLFGTSVTFNPSDNGLLVGAPGVFATNTQTPVGAAYYYTLLGSEWIPKGPPIKGDSNVFAANERFGSSVAAGSSGVVAVGAPSSSFGNVVERGRVYTFAYNSSLSVWVNRGGNETITGDSAGDLLGSSVGISSDGSTLVAGAPGSAGGAGACSIYEWTGLAWSLTFTSSGNSMDERFGESVAILSSDGGFVAAGAPGYSGGSGIIRVFRRQQKTYTSFGPPIVGEEIEALGTALGVTGSVDDTGVPVVLAGTSSGAIKTFSFNTATNAWEQRIEVTITSVDASPAVSGSTALGLMVAGKEGIVDLYSLS
jgi:hypothetical protein